MEKSDWFLLIFTFVVGMSAGVYLYTTSFRPVYQVEDLLPVLSLDAELNITGRAYGDARTGYEYPSFRVIDGGQYAYLPGGAYDGTREPVEGTLPGRVYRTLEAAVASADLDTFTAPSGRQRCSGTNYAYRVIVDGTEYELDTCGTTLDPGDDLTMALDAVWEYLADEHSANTANDAQRPMECTLEAKICPDGSTVGRTGPNCEFAACPGE